MLRVHTISSTTMIICAGAETAILSAQWPAGRLRDIVAKQACFGRFFVLTI